MNNVHFQPSFSLRRLIFPKRARFFTQTFRSRGKKSEEIYEQAKRLGERVGSEKKAGLKKCTTIAIDIRLLGKKRTGDEMVFFHLTKEILKLDKENYYALLTDETEAEKIQTLYARLECAGQENVKIISLPSKNRFIWNLWTLPKYLFQNKIDVFHTQYILPLFAPRRTKIITHIHDVSFRAYPQLIGWSDRFFLKIFIPCSLRKTALIITPSQFTKDEIVKYYNVRAEKIAVIPNAIGEEFLGGVNPESDLLLKEKYHLPEKYILYVGTLQPRKNIPFLIEAFAKLQKHLRNSNVDATNIKLVLVGNRAGYHTDKSIDEIITEKNLENDVVFSGFIDQKDLPSVCRLAHIFVFPSLYEGFGIPLLEAMSQRVPIAASDIPSLRETALEAATYFNPADIANCEEKLYTLSVDQKRREELVQRGKERLSYFSWQESAKLLHNVYNLLLKS
jgi:glycosyltransferase involved in cell wall biosynthesis